MDNMLREMLLKKLRGDEDRTRFYEDQEAKDRARAGDLSALQAITRGAAQVGAIGGKVADTEATTDMYQNQIKGLQDNAKNYIDKQRLANQQDDSRFQAASKLAAYDEEKAESDPNSKRSVQARASMAAILPSFAKDPSFQKLSAKDLKERSSLYNNILSGQTRESLAAMSASKPTKVQQTSFVDPETGQPLVFDPNQGTYGPAKSPVGGGTPSKRLPPATVTNVNDGKDSIRLLDGLEQQIKDKSNLFGPVVGTVGGANPYAQDAQLMQANLKTAAQLIGKFMEDGVLRKEDEVKYEKMLPNLRDTPEVAAGKLVSVRKMLQDKQNSRVSALGEQKYDVSGLGGSTDPDEDTAAIAWAKDPANAKDPRAIKILQMHNQ